MRLQKTTERNSLALGGLRIAVGCLFLIFARYKVFGTHFTLHGGFEWWVNQFLQSGSAYPFVVPVLGKFVLPNAIPIAFIVAYGELAIGMALVLGICVRPASAFGNVLQWTAQLQPEPRRHSGSGQRVSAQANGRMRILP